MKYLLDTHTVLWYVLGNPNLKVHIKQIIDTKQGLYFSSISLWEIAIKVNIGKLQLNCSFDDLIKRLSYLKTEILPITTLDIQYYLNLPLHHRDPFDRILVAQAVNNQLILISRDPAFDNYAIQRLW